MIYSCSSVIAPATSTIKCFLKYKLYQIECFFQSVFCIQHWILIPIYGQLPFENNFKRTINCPVTRVNMNESSTLRTALSLLCDERYATTDKFSVLMRTCHSLLRDERRRATMVPARMRAIGRFGDASLERLHQGQWRF